MSSTAGAHAPNKPVRLRNTTCIYCGMAFGGDVERSKEHVIARKFVPGVSFDGQWNLIAWACHRCNREKSQLEDDVSAITMQLDVLGRHAAEDERLREHAARKAIGSQSRRTGRSVSASNEQLTVRGELMPGVAVSFGLVSPPQLDPDRAFALARFHLQAFFYLITYDRQKRLGHTWVGAFGPVGFVPKSDWGNPQMRAFRVLLASWQHRVHAIGADEYFKLVIHRSPEDVPLWAWAIEWNKSYRLIGFVGEPTAMREAFRGLTIFGKRVIEQTPRYTTLFHEEHKIDSEEDRMFDPPEPTRRRIALVDVRVASAPSARDFKIASHRHPVAGCG